MSSLVVCCRLTVRPGVAQMLLVLPTGENYSPKAAELPLHSPRHATALVSVKTYGTRPPRPSACLGSARQSPNTSASTYECPVQPSVPTCVRLRSSGCYRSASTRDRKVLTSYSNSVLSRRPVLSSDESIKTFHGTIGRALACPFH